MPGSTGAPQTLAAVVETAFAADGILARTIPGYETRDGQRAMGTAVASVIDSG